ncbi:hypothetical protein GH714_020728 [Hevea brasiliensis]|uniref:BOP1 N-terminal domain-containing protein n=1 Tax=Hevea brasiliensis TaxID=3981 RepID=A0A6A6N5W2_HEVBR|nr:hypothetical protein GH714_020728 [Hevea brasiliensis]
MGVGKDKNLGNLGKQKSKNTIIKEETISSQSNKEKVNNSEEPEHHQEEEEEEIASDSESDYQELSDYEDEFMNHLEGQSLEKAILLVMRVLLRRTMMIGMDNEDQSNDSESGKVAEESDSSEDEVAPRNTIGDVPLKWYEDEKHIGYDITGKKITKKERQDKLESFLASADDSENWRKIYDEYNDEVVELTKEEIKVIRRLVKGKAPHLDFDPYPAYSDWFNGTLSTHYQMLQNQRGGLLPQSGKLKWYTSLRSIPAYENAVKDSFERCLDLYLCPRVRKKRINIDPKSLKPKLPSRKDLKPYPVTCYLEYKGHNGAVMSISTEASGQWIASGLNVHLPYPLSFKFSNKTFGIFGCGSDDLILSFPIKHLVSLDVDLMISYLWKGSTDGTVRVWEGTRCNCLNTGLGNEEVQKKVKELLHVEMSIPADDSGNKSSSLSWVRDEKHEGIKLRHFSVLMEFKEQFCCSLLSKKLTQRLPFKLRGLPVSSVFHPTRSVFFVATKKNVRVYDLLKHKLIKKLETGLREVSSIAVHPAGDNVIVGSKEGKLCWFDMDLSSKPYKILKYVSSERYNKRGVPSFIPLFASCSDDCTAYVFHGMVYSDLNQNPLIVPLEILRGHSSSNGRGIMDCKFHPRQPWLFTAGADSSIKLYCH